MKGPAPPGTQVTYTIHTNSEDRSRALGLTANEPVIPIMMDIANPQKVRVAITGLSQSALHHTRVYVYDANTHYPGQYYDPTKSDNSEEMRTIRTILRQPAQKIDFARAKLVIDKLIDPSIDVESTLNTIAAMVGQIKALPEYGEDSAAKLQALRRYIYEPGAWNDNQPYRYDLDDPLGKNISNKLLAHYLATKKGNCVTMPLLFVILGQRLGLDITATTAPSHILVKVRDRPMGVWYNLEATSGAKPMREVWLRGQMPMTDEALANGLYLQPLTQKEVVALMATVLSEYALDQQAFDKALAIDNLTLEYYPKNVESMVRNGAACARLIRKYFIERYPTPSQIPTTYQGYYAYLGEQNRLWYANAEALGWREPTKEEDEQYLQKIDQVRQQQNPLLIR